MWRERGHYENYRGEEETNDGNMNGQVTEERSETETRIVIRVILRGCLNT